MWGPGTSQIAANLERAEAAHEHAMESGRFFAMIFADALVCRHLVELLRGDHPEALALQGTEVGTVWNRIRNERTLLAMRAFFETRELRLRNAMALQGMDESVPPSPAESAPQPDTADES